MEHHSVLPIQNLIINSSIVDVNPEKVYEWQFNIEDLKVSEKSVYAAIIFLDDKKEEVARRCRFITNNLIKEYSIICSVPTKAKYAVLGFRVNCEGVKPSQVQIKFPFIDDCKLIIVKDKSETYDEDFDYEEAFRNENLEKNHWHLVGGGKNVEEFLQNGRIKVEVLKELGLTSNAALLDVGCGTGILIEHLKNFLISPKNYVGTDLSLDVIEFCKRRYPSFEFYRNSMTKLPKLDRKFDMICLFSVFTHMRPSEIIELLLDMKQYLKPGGSIIATVFINSKIPTFTGTRSKIEINEEYFLNMIKSVGFSKVTNKKNTDIVQDMYQISL